MNNTWVEDEVAWYTAAHNQYKVDRSGNVYLLDGKSIKKPATDKDGYLFYTFHFSKRHHFSKRAARVVWEAWDGPVPPGTTVDHINGDRKDNAISNLRLLTAEENVRRAKEKPFSFTHVPSQVCVSGMNVAEFCRTFGICPKRMSEVQTGKRASHQGWEKTNA